MVCLCRYLIWGTQAGYSPPGSESIPVREVQRAETDSNGGLLVTSIPQIGVPGGSKFQAVAKLSVSNGTDAGTFGCKVT